MTTEHKTTIPFNRVALMGGEVEHIRQAIANMHTSGHGPFCRKCEDLLAVELQTHRVLLTPSGTHAIEMAASLLGIGPGDEVIVPSFTFSSTANAFAIRGATPVFVDSRPDTLNLDEGLLGDLVTDRTKAIVPVHYAGVGCEMPAIMDVADASGVAVIEDNAHGTFGRYRGRRLGTFGCLAALSFHETKNFTCGEGGALMVNDPGYAGRAEFIQDKGTDRRRFLRGQVDKYTWVDIGSSYVVSDLLAAFLWAQLEQRHEIQAARRRLWDRYAQSLADWADAAGVHLPVVPDHCEQSYHMFYLMMRTEDDRNALIAHLADNGICAVFHYVPLHSSPMGRRCGRAPLGCPVSEDVSRRLIRLPFYTTLSEEDQESVIQAVLRFEP